MGWVPVAALLFRERTVSQQRAFHESHGLTTQATINLVGLSGQQHCYPALLTISSLLSASAAHGCRFPKVSNGAEPSHEFACSSLELLWELQADLCLQFSTCQRINKNIFVSVCEPLSCKVLKHLASAENPALMFIQVMTWAPTALICRQQEPGAIGIFEHLRSVNLHFLKVKSLWVGCLGEEAPAP